MNKIALVLPFVLIAIAPIVGRWRANVWLKRHQLREDGHEMAQSFAERA